MQNVDIPTTGYGGMGFPVVPQTYTPEAAPGWMQGGQMDLGGQGYQGMEGLGKGMPNWFQMPQWGMDAVTGQPLTQAALQGPAATQQQAAAPAPAADPRFGAGGVQPTMNPLMRAYQAGAGGDVAYGNQNNLHLSRYSSTVPNVQQDAYMRGLENRKAAEKQALELRRNGR
jgi:hypothetical protein